MEEVPRSTGVPPVIHVEHDCARNAVISISNGVSPPDIAAITGETPVPRKRFSSTGVPPVIGVEDG